MTELVTIDGSIGYGQVLRTAVSLSALTLQPIRIINIRAGCPRPGLMPQHLAGIKIAGEFCNAELRGAQYGSMEIEFLPKELNVSDKRIDIGTAGSIGLLLQTLLPLLVFAEKSTNLEISGGTAGLGAPSVEYIKHVTLQMLTKFGLDFDLAEFEIMRQGFYPRGGGLVKVKIKPVSRLGYANILQQGTIKMVKGFSIAGSLPETVATRQANAAKEFLLQNGIDSIVDIEAKSVETLSQGTSITIFEQNDESILGADGIGRRGVRSEEIGKEVAEEFLKSLRSGAALDKWMGDQIVPFIALASGRSSMTVEEITDHCRTNMFVCEKILRVKFEVEGKKISCDGIGFSAK